MERSRVLVVSQDSVGERMAGPAIRAYELSRVLARDHEVVLAAPQRAELDGDGFTIRAYEPGLVKASDVIVAFGRLLTERPEVVRTDAAVVVDLYDPVPFEALVHHASGSRSRERRWLDARDARRVLLAQLERGDLFLCASERQRDLVVGMLTAAGRVNPATFDLDPSLDALVEVVPFGLPDTPPVPSGANPLRGQGRPFSDDDLVVLWGGGLYDWLDPVVLVDAVARAAPKVKAYFLGGRHPSPEVPPMAARDAAIARARDLDLLGARVVFADEWVPYDRRADYLLDADVGVSLHRRHLETRFAFRTRVLDYLWAALPIVCTEGDVVADLVADRGLGAVVPPSDPDALAGALDELRDDETRKQAGSRVAVAAERFTWDTVAAPLVDFCRAPRRAPDRDTDLLRWRRTLETRARVHEGVQALRRRLGSR